MIKYNVIVRDDYGPEYFMHQCRDVNEAIEVAKNIEEDVIDYIEATIGGNFRDGVDIYHQNHPNKRFEVVVEVEYD